MHVQDAAGVARRLPAGLAAVAGEGRVTFDLGAYPPVDGEPADVHLQPSFLIDFDEKPVRDLTEALRAALSSGATVEALVEFTASHIPAKGMGWGWQIASQAARRGQGDCTEHAVLLAALARLAGLPARVVTGVLLASTEQRTLAAGHAWTEIHDGTQWRPADATGVERQAAVRYVPLMSLTDETAGFQSPIMQHLQTGWPRLIELAMTKSSGSAP